MHENLQGRWIHSHEEDTPTEKVFRPDSFAFPPSRGRVGFELRADGSYLDIGIAAADGRLETEGKWSFEDDILTLTCDVYSGGQSRLRVIACDDARLVIEK